MASWRETELQRMYEVQTYGEISRAKVEYIPIVETNSDYSVIERYILDRLTYNPFVPIEIMYMASWAHSYSNLKRYFPYPAPQIVINWCRSVYGDVVLNYRGFTLYKEIKERLRPYLKGLTGASHEANDRMGECHEGNSIA